MRAQLLGVLQAPAGKLVATIEKPARGPPKGCIKAFSEEAPGRSVMLFKSVVSCDPVYY